MLLIDGVKYKEWIISNEDELEKMVIEHAQDIFSENSIYFDKKQKLRSIAGVGTIPDGLAIILSENPQWHIVEVELSSHDPYEHIVPQVDKFINATENTNSRNKIVEALYEVIENDILTKLKTKQAIGQNKDIHKFLSDLIIKTPFITIVIEKDTSQLREALRKYPQKKVVEFQTFKRQDAETVHAHLFEPLFKLPPPMSVPNPIISNHDIIRNSIDIRFWSSYQDYSYIGIWKKYRYLFPAIGTTIELVDNNGEIFQADVREYEGSMQLWFHNLFKKHSYVKEGDIIRILIIEPMKRYRIEFLREGKILLPSH